MLVGKYIQYALAALLSIVTSLHAVSAETATFTNPVAPDGHDPWVILHDQVYLYCYSHQNKIWVNQSNDLSMAVQFNGKVVWQPQPGKPFSRQLWAPELHHLDGKWYIYVAASDGNNFHHRMYVLRSDKPDGPFALVGELATPSDKWAIDGTVLEHGNKRYFIWSGWEGEVNDAQHLYIAEMASPTELRGKRVKISSPELPWELRSGRPRKDGSKMPLINEGPQVLKNGGRTFIIYSASGSWTNHYCLGMLTLAEPDPMNPESWNKSPEPVFQSTDRVIAPGHASFTTSLDGRDHWIVYHAAKFKGAGWKRQTHMQRFEFAADGSPVFGEPLDPGIPVSKQGIAPE